MIRPQLVKCKKCGWHHFEVTSDHVRNWLLEWKGYFETKPKEWLEVYGVTDKPPGPEEYLECFRCSGSYKDFIDVDPVAADNFGKMGHTITPILRREDSL